MFDGLEVVQFAGGVPNLRVDRLPHADLGIDATVVAKSFYGLGDQQYCDGQKADAAHHSQNWIRMITHHFSRRELLLPAVFFHQNIFGHSGSFLVCHERRVTCYVRFDTRIAVFVE